MTVDPKASLAFVERREARRQAALDARFEEARRDAQVITDMLIEKYRPRRIYQWGSLLNRRTFWERSDIDIALEGIPDAETFFRLYGDADRLARFPLDLVALEHVEPEFAELIRTKGRLVYER
jgi:predicted nucleotidyltransferase